MNLIGLLLGQSSSINNVLEIVGLIERKNSKFRTPFEIFFTSKPINPMLSLLVRSA